MLGGTLARLEADALREALQGQPSLTAAARALGLSRDALTARLARYGIALPRRFRARPGPPAIPEPSNAGRPFCESFHRWYLAYRHPSARGVTRVWHCRTCPAVRQDG